MRAPGVFVLGMHRSGTSAAVLCLEAIGLKLCVEGDRLTARRGNIDHGESLSIISVNDKIFEHYNGSWQFPNMPDGWTKDPLLGNFSSTAKKEFEKVHPTSPWAVKDPRFCLTLPFWEQALNQKPPVVLVVRNPIEVADSLTAREEKAWNRRGRKYYLGLWERYMRTALLNLEGHRVLVISYEELLKDWNGHRKKIQEWLRQNGIEVEETSSKSPLRPRLRHNNASESTKGLSARQKVLYATLKTLQGEHGSLSLPNLGRESGYTKRLFNSRLDRMSEVYSTRRFIARFRQMDTPVARRKLAYGLATAAILALTCLAIAGLPTFASARDENQWLSYQITSIAQPVAHNVLAITSELVSLKLLTWVAISAGVLAFVVGRRLLAFITLLGVVIGVSINIIMDLIIPASATGALLRATMMLALLTYLCWACLRQRVLQIGVGIVCVLLSLTIGMSQIYFNDLQPTTVVAVILLASSLVAIVVTLGEILKLPVERARLT